MSVTWMPGGCNSPKSWRRCAAVFEKSRLRSNPPPALPREWPAQWMQPETVGRVVRFVESQFDERRTAEQARRIFPDFRDMEATGLPLRSIVVTLAKASRGGSGAAQVRPAA